MNKKAISKTAITYWSNEDECFIVQSPLMKAIMGVGETVKEAQTEFRGILSDAYEAYLEGKLAADRVGRPAKNRIAFNSDVQPETKISIKNMASDFQCSQGEVVDYLLFFHQHFKTATSLEKGEPKESSALLNLRKRVENLELAIPQNKKARKK